MRSSRTGTCRGTSTATSRGSASPRDEPLLAEDDVRYKGQPIAAVAAETEEAALAAVDAIEIAYEERPAHFDMRTGLDPDAAQIHQWGNVYPHYGPYNHRRVRKGDIDWAFDTADAIVEGVYRPQAIEQMPLETQVAVAVPEANGRLTIYSCTQAMYFSMGVVAAHLQVPLNKLKFVGGTVGGGFGGKVDTATETICALLALKARRPVKWRWTREEEFLVSSTRAPWHIEIADAVTEGRLDPRPADAHAPRRGCLRALLARTASRSTRSTTAARTRSRTSASTGSSASRTACRRLRCGASASRRCRSRSRRT